jgi:hypothetical protein
MTTVELKRIVLVEDNVNDIELTLIALKNCNLANDVVAIRDGAEALDLLVRRGPFVAREEVIQL